MFTGIIEAFGEVQGLEKEGENLHISLKSDLAGALKIDQSLAHNGVCLTVVACNAPQYTVTAIKETLAKTNLHQLSVGSKMNLERAMVAGSRFDGHMVQGHVDQVAECVEIKDEAGSWRFTFAFSPKEGNVIIEKGSITINGVSLTLVDVESNRFSVAIIPYTYQHTNFHQLEVGSLVNLEFDMIGKYIAKLHSQMKN
jgi:riboflavin synthase